MPMKPKASPTRLVAGHLIGRVGRPSRFRSRALMILLGIAGTVLLILGRRNAVSTKTPWPKPKIDFPSA
jgi:hypothetical protein